MQGRVQGERVWAAAGQKRGRRFAGTTVVDECVTAVHSAEQAREEYRNMPFPEQWSVTPAVRNNRVYALEANGYFSRPGPRLATGIEILAKAFQPMLTVSAEAEQAILPIAVGSATAPSATARAASS